jgi:hypothetical protein
MKECIFKILVVIFLSFAALLNGCATMNDVERVKDAGTEGTTKVYPVTADQAWEISKTVFRWEGSDAIEEHRDQGYMLTSSGMNMVSRGEPLWERGLSLWINTIQKSLLSQKDEYP